MHGDTRATIREVALEFFATRGFDQTSLREIAERVGLTKASLYYHYPSKQALLTAILAPLFDGWRSVTTRIENLPRTPDNVRLVLADLLDVMLRNRSLAGILFRDPAGVVAAAGSLWEDMIDMSVTVTGWIAGPDPSTEEQLRAVAAMEVLGGVLTSMTYLKAEVSDEDMREVLLDSALRALRLVNH